MLALSGPEFYSCSGATNDLVANRPEVVGSEIDDVVQLMQQSYSVWLIGVCEVIPRVTF